MHDFADQALDFGIFWRALGMHFVLEHPEADLKRLVDLQVKKINEFVERLQNKHGSRTTVWTHKLYGHAVIYPIQRSGCPYLPLPPNRAARLPFTTSASPNVRYSTAWCRTTLPLG